MFAPFRVVDGEWRLDRDALAAAAESASGMLLMSPSMPSGGTFDEEDWRLACDLCREHDLFLVYDAAMERLLFDGRPLVHPLHFEGMAERTLVVGSLSKEHRMIGWRVGWVAGPAATIEDVGWAHVYNTTTPVGIARRAATEVLRGDQGHVAECVAELERRRDFMLEALADWPVVKPGGGWSLLLDVAELGIRAGGGLPPAARGGLDRGDRHAGVGSGRGRAPRPLRLQRRAARALARDPEAAREELSTTLRPTRPIPRARRPSPARRSTSAGPRGRCAE